MGPSPILMTLDLVSPISTSKLIYISQNGLGFLATFSSSDKYHPSNLGVDPPKKTTAGSKLRFFCIVSEVQISMEMMRGKKMKHVAGMDVYVRPSAGRSTIETELLLLPGRKKTHLV